MQSIYRPRFCALLLLLALTLPISGTQATTIRLNSAILREQTASITSLPRASQPQPTGTPATAEVASTHQPTSQLTFPTLSAPTPSEDAQAAISQFNQERLGSKIQVVYAGNLTNTIQPVLQRLPPSIQAAMLDGINISSVSYWGLLSGGVAMVTVGDCTTDIAFCTITSDNLSDQLSNASAGIYAVVVKENPAAAQAAATLIRATFPKLDLLLLNPIDTIESGFAFSAVTTNTGYDVYSKQATLVPEVIYAGTVPYGSSGRTLVYALVALGEGYVRATVIEGATLNLRQIDLGTNR
jgi:hypothetical protein